PISPGAAHAPSGTPCLKLHPRKGRRAERERLPPALHQSSRGRCENAGPGASLTRSADLEPESWRSNPQGIEALLDDAVAAATDAFQAWSVEDTEVAAVVADQPGPLRSAPRWAGPC